MINYFSQAIAIEELFRDAGGIALSYGAHSNLCINQICRNGNEEQKKKYLPEVTNGPVADTYVIYAKTDSKKHQHGITCFIVERGTPGFTQSPGAG